MGSVKKPIACVCYACRFMGLGVEDHDCPDCGRPLIRVLDTRRIDVRLLFRTPGCYPRLPGVRLVHAAHGQPPVEPANTAWSVVQFRDVTKR